MSYVQASMLLHDKDSTQKESKLMAQCVTGGERSSTPPFASGSGFQLWILDSSAVNCLQSFVFNLWTNLVLGSSSISSAPQANVLFCFLPSLD